MQFGDVLRELLEEKEMSQKQLADELNLLAPTLGRYIRNEREPDIETIKTIAKYFNVSTDYLLDFHTGKTHSHMEDELLRVFRSMTLEQQDIFVEQGKAIERINKNEKTKSS